MRGILVIGIMLVCVVGVIAQDSDSTGLQVREEDGGTVMVRTANGVLNQNSSLKRRWISIDDPSAPARLSRVGLFARFDEKEDMHLLVPVGTVSPNQAISALEVRYALFDVWGQHLTTLSLTRLSDTSTSIDFRDMNGWPALEAEVAQLVTVVAFVSRVRTADGRIWKYNRDATIEKMRSLGLTVSAADLVADEQRMLNPKVIYWQYYPPRRSRPAER